MKNRLDALVDVMRVPVDGDPRLGGARRGLPEAREIDCDVLVVGGGTGGVAAALAAARRGRRVHLLEETDWIGGQLTAQGIAALDEHEHIETFGGTASYYQLRNALRDHYRPFAGEAGRRPHFNPGNCWVTRVAFEPKVAVAAMMALLQPHIAGRVTLHLRTKVAAVEAKDDRIVSVAPSSRGGDATVFRPAMVIDATELGDLLPLAGAEYWTARRPLPRQASRMPSRSNQSQLRAELHLCVRAGAPAAGRAPRHRASRALRVISCRTALQLADRGARRRDLRRGERLADVRSVRHHARHEGRAMDVSPPGRQRAVRHAFETDISMFNWPGNDYRETSSSIVPRGSRGGFAGCQASQPRLLALAADGGAS